MRPILGGLLVVLAAACGDSREKECEQVRDRELKRQRARVAEAIGEAPPDMRARLQAQADAEIERTRVAFVRVCRAMKGLDLACIDDEAKADTAACRDATRQFWQKVLGEPPR